MQTINKSSHYINMSLNEGGQTNLIRFALANENFEILHPFVKCRDYLGDVVWSEYYDVPISQYGFKWKPCNFNKDRIRFVLMVHDNTQFLEQLRNNLNELREWTNDPTIELLEVDPQSPGLTDFTDMKYILLLADKKWYTDIIHMSWFTYLIKIAASYKQMSDLFLDNPNDTSNEKYYARGFEGFLRWFVVFFDEIARKLNKEFPPKKTRSDIVHSASGFFSKRRQILPYIKENTIFEP